MDRLTRFCLLLGEEREREEDLNIEYGICLSSLLIIPTLFDSGYLEKRKKFGWKNYDYFWLCRTDIFMIHPVRHLIFRRGSQTRNRDLGVNGMAN